MTDIMRDEYCKYVHKAVADGLVDLVWPDQLTHGKNKILCYVRQVIHKRARVNFGFDRLVILL